MPVEMGMWRIDGDAPRRLAAAVLPSEAALENYLNQDPSLLGEPLLVIGQQVVTPHGKRIDLLAIDGDGNLHVLELKRDRTPRDVVAQVLDYGSWVTTLDRDAVVDIANRHLTIPFEEAFADVFGGAPPDDINTELRLTIVATDLDAGSERIVTYLREFGVPINAVFFSYLEDGGRRYLARSWLATESETPSATSAPKRGKRAEWNGHDWFVSFGEDSSEGRSWDDARRFGFVSAGGGTWYSRTLKSLPLGARVNVLIPGRGYVGVGETLAPATRFDETKVTIGEDTVRLADQPLIGRYRYGSGDEPDSDEVAEYVVPVRWFVAEPRETAYWEKGMFANENSACKLRQEFTLDKLAQHFQVDGDDDVPGAPSV